MTNLIEATAKRAEQLAGLKGAPASIKPMANLIRYAKGSVGLKWIADNCEAQSRSQDREDHAAMFRVIAKRLNRALAA